MGDLLTDVRYERFAYLVAAGTATYKAYLLAGFAANAKSASVAGSRLLADPVIRDRIAEISSSMNIEIYDRALITKEWVICSLHGVYQRSMREHTIGVDGTVVAAKFNGATANRALELIGKELGMFVERREFKFRNISDLDDSEIENLLAGSDDSLDAASRPANGASH